MFPGTQTHSDKTTSRQGSPLMSFRSSRLRGRGHLNCMTKSKDPFPTPSWSDHESQGKERKEWQAKVPPCSMVRHCIPGGEGDESCVYVYIYEYIYTRTLPWTKSRHPKPGPIFMDGVLRQKQFTCGCLWGSKNFRHVHSLSLAAMAN